MEIIEIRREELSKLNFPHSEAFLTVFMPADQVHNVQNNIYSQLDDADK